MAKKNIIGVEKKAVKRVTAKQKMKRYAMWGGGGIVFISLVTWAATRPQYGTSQFAVCKVFAETQLYYPATMRVNDAEYIETAEAAGVINGASDRVWEIVYSYIGPSGEARSDEMRCKFGTDPQSGQMMIVSAQLNRQPVDDDIVTKFNVAIPAVLAMKPSMVLPATLGDNLVSLRPDSGENEDQPE